MRGWLGATFDAVGVRRYRRFLSGVLFTFLGLHSLTLARGYLAFELTGSNAALGGLFFAFGLPLILLVAWGGVTADRAPRVLVVTACLAAMFLQVAMVGAAIVAGRIEYWMLWAQALCEGTTVAFMVPSRQSLIRDLLPDDQIASGFALTHATSSLAKVVGPAASGALIAWPLVGVRGVYLAIAVVFTLAAWRMYGLPRARKQPARPHVSPLRDLADGVRYVRRRPALRVLLLSSYVIALTIVPWNAFLPSLVKEVHGRGSFELGVMNALTAAGAVVAALIVGARAGRSGAWRLHAALGLLFAAALILLGAAPSFPLALAAGALVGAIEVAFYTLNMSLALSYADRAYDGRVQGLAVSAFSLFGLVSLPLGILADRIGIRETLVAQGAVALLLLLALQLYARRIAAAADARVPADAEAAAAG